MARPAAVLIARAATTPSAAAVERAVMAEPVVSTVNGLSTRSHPARGGGVVHALAGVPAGTAEGDTSMVGLSRAGAHQGEHGGGRQRCRRLESLPPGRVTRECADGGVEAMRIHNSPPFGLTRPPGAVRHPSLMPDPDV